MARNSPDGDGIEYIHPRLIDTSPGVAALLPESLARECNILSQGMKGRVLTVLIDDPDDFASMDRLRFTLSCSEIRFAQSSRRAIQEAIERVYGTPEL